MTHVTELIDQVLAKAEKTPPPASTADVDKVLADVAGYDRLAAGTTLPADYLAFMRRSNGPIIDAGDNDVRFLSLGDEGWDTFAAYNGDDSALMDDEIDEYAGFLPLLLFAANVGSDFWAFDADGAVVFCDHESGDVWPQASTFADFLQQMVDGTATDRDVIEAVEPAETSAAAPPVRLPSVVDEARDWLVAEIPRVYVIEPDKPGNYGPRTESIPPKDNRSQPTRLRVECELERWPVDAIMCVGTEVLVTDGFAADLLEAEMTGFEVQEALVSVNAKFRQRETDRADQPLPNLSRLIVTGNAEHDQFRRLRSHDGADLAIGRNNAQRMLIASERFVHLLDGHGAKKCPRALLSWAGI